MIDQFLRPAKSQSKLYWLSSDHKADPSAVSTWCTDACKLKVPTAELPDSLASLLPIRLRDVFHRKRSEGGRSLQGR